MSSLFGDLETPQGNRLPERQLSELTLKVHGATWDTDRKVVRLRAEAATAFADGTAGDGVVVGFFLNSCRLTELPTDDYGLATLDHECAEAFFFEGTNALVLRVKGFARQVEQRFEVVKPKRNVSTPPQQEKPLPRFNFQQISVEVQSVPQIEAAAKRLVFELNDYKQAVQLLDKLSSGVRDPQLYRQSKLLSCCVDLLDQWMANVNQQGATPRITAVYANALQELMPRSTELQRLVASLPPIAANDQEVVNLLRMLERKVQDSRHDWSQKFSLDESLTYLKCPPVSAVSATEMITYP